MKFTVSRAGGGEYDTVPTRVIDTSSSTTGGGAPSPRTVLADRGGGGSPRTVAELPPTPRHGRPLHPHHYSRSCKASTTTSPTSPYITDDPPSEERLSYESSLGTSGIYDGIDGCSGGCSEDYDGYGNAQPMARRGLMYARRQKRRLIMKDGECNISLSNINRRKRRYLGDIFTTLLDMKWRYNVLMFAAAFVGSWFVFACVWLVIALLHGDHKNIDNEDWAPCVVGVYDFPTALLFSVETQHTIGYGSRSMDTTCPYAYVILMMQSCVGVFIQSLLTGIIFAKLSRPKGRSHTLTFSRTAVICLRDGHYCLMFRVADMRKSRIVAATVRAMMVKNRISKEGELLPLSQIPLEVNAESGDYNIFLVWPVTVMHIIDEKSPLWGVSAEQLISEQFEIIAILEGTIESTGMTTQVRTSYLPSEVMWGHRQAPLLNYQKENGQYKVDYTRFHCTLPVEMPECSAQEYAAKHGRPSTSSAAGPGGNCVSDERPASVRTYNAPNHRGYSMTGMDNASVSLAQLQRHNASWRHARRFTSGGRRILGKIRRRPASMKNPKTPPIENGVPLSPVSKNISSSETITPTIEEEKALPPPTADHTDIEHEEQDKDGNIVGLV